MITLSRMARNFGRILRQQVVDELNGGMRGGHFGGVNGAGDQHHRLSFGNQPGRFGGRGAPWIGELGLDVPVVIQVSAALPPS